MTKRRDLVRIVSPFTSPATMPREQAEQIRERDSALVRKILEAGAGCDCVFYPYLEQRGR
jgi:hypothetical protein